MSRPLASVITCQINDLSIARAKKLVAPQYSEAWDWYEANEGKATRWVPMGQNNPKEYDFPLGQQAGIHPIGVTHLPRDWKKTKRYALSITSSGSGSYTDSPVIYRPDGTWTLDYSSQKAGGGRRQTTNYNAFLMNCLDDGIPIGVIARRKKGEYTILGLGFVERYNSRGETFTIHGPANRLSDEAGQFSSDADGMLSREDLARKERLLALGIGNDDERVRALMRGVRRERQSAFRRAVLSAYDGKCAICGTSLPDVLQAAHIDDYRGAKSQIVNNGILLRADLHLMYDANLLGIEPISHRIVLAEDAHVEPYEELLRDAKLRLPTDPSLCPDDSLLRLHYEQFEMQNRVA